MDHDSVSTEHYTVNMPVDPAALAAMVATTGIDMGLSKGLAVVRVIVFAGIAALFLGRNSEMGGWFTTSVLLIGLLFGQLWLMWRRHGMGLIAAGLLDRFGAARFRAASPIIDSANRIIDEV